MTTGTDGSARSLQVFISYRREDAADAAGRLYDRLREAFGDRIFMDVDNIPPGVDFVQAIDTAVGECDVFLAVIGKKWLTARDNARRQRRLELPEDFVRLELLAALRRTDVWVIPVLVHGARMPSPAELPDDLTAFARRNAVSVTHTNWASDVGGLVRSIQGLARRKETDEKARADGDAQARRQADEKATELRTVSEEAPVAGTEGAAAGPTGAAGRAAEIEAMLDEFTETGVMPHGLMEQLGQIDDPALMDRLLEKVRAVGADELGSRPALQIADHYVDGPDRYKLWWPLSGPGLSLPVAFEDLDRPTQFHVLWAEFSYRLTQAKALRNEGSLDEAHTVFQECLERAAQLDVGVLKEESYEGLMRVAERRGDHEAVKRYLHLAQQEHLRANR